MFNGNTPAAAPAGGRRWLPLGVVGALAVVAGIALPRMLGTGAAPAVPADPPPAAAADPEKGSLEYTPPTWGDEPDPRALLGRLAAGTAVVLVLCVLTLVLCRRWLRRLPGQGAGPGRMSLVETLPLGNRCAVHLVRVGGRQVLVGVDGGGLKSLVALPGDFDDALAAAQGAPVEAPPAIPAGPALAALVGPPRPAAW